MKIVRILLLLAVVLGGAFVARRLLAAGTEDLPPDMPLAPVPPMPETP